MYCVILDYLSLIIHKKFAVWPQGMHPPFSFEKENGPCTVQKKTISAQMPQHLGEKRGSSESVQPEIGALLPSAPYSRRQPTAPPHNRCDVKPGRSSKGLSVYSRAVRFATRCRVHTRQRQRKEKQGHAMTAPFKIGPRLSGPDYGAEALRRTRQKADDFSQQRLRRLTHL